MWMVPYISQMEDDCQRSPLHTKSYFRTHTLHHEILLIYFEADASLVA